MLGPPSPPEYAEDNMQHAKARCTVVFIEIIQVCSFREMDWLPICEEDRGARGPRAGRVDRLMFAAFTFKAISALAP